jgi:hypothetical protein
MVTLGDDIPTRRSANDPNEGLRIRLSGRALPDPLRLDIELRRIVMNRLSSPHTSGTKRGVRHG